MWGGIRVSETNSSILEPKLTGKLDFSWNFVIWHVPRVHLYKPCLHSNVFHILWIELRFRMRKAIASVAGGKIVLAKTNWFFRVKSSIFLPKSIHNSNLTCHSTCPLPQRILLSKRKTVSTSHIWSLTCGGDSRQRSDFAYFGALAPRRRRFFMKFQHLRLATGHPCKHGVTMGALVPTKLIENKFSGTSGVTRRLRNEKIHKASS